jgi:ureidoglycolate hydrolase
MRERTLNVSDITVEDFKDYGLYLDPEKAQPDHESEQFNFWNKLAVLPLKSASFCIVESYPQGAIESSTFEQHGNTHEVLIPTEGEIVLVIALPDRKDKARIDMESVRAFRLPAGKAVALKPFVWHYAPLVKDRPVKTFVVFEEQTPEDDMHMRYTDKEQEVIFKVEGV